MKLASAVIAGGLIGCSFPGKREGRQKLRDGTKIWHQERRGEEGFSPVVFIHGNAQNHTAIEPIADSLNSLGHPIVLYDLPGHGGSEVYRDRVYSMERFSETLQGVMGAANCRSPILVGHSMGGMIALDYATRYQGNVRSLVLIDTADADPIKLNNKFLLEQVVEGIVKKAHEISETSGKGRPYEFRSGLSEEDITNEGLRNTDPSALEGNFRATSSYDVRRELKNLKIPVVIIRGDKDPLMTEDMTEEMRERIQNSRVYTIEGGHNVVVQRPDLVINIILENHEFLRGTHSSIP